MHRFVSSMSLHAACWAAPRYFDFGDCLEPENRAERDNAITALSVIGRGIIRLFCVTSSLPTQMARDPRHNRHQFPDAEQRKHGHHYEGWNKSLEVEVEIHSEAFLLVA